MSESEEISSDDSKGVVKIFLPPIYEYHLRAFDNEETSPNLTFVIQGLEKPLRLHKDTLCRVSKYIERVLKEKQEKGEDNSEIVWMFDTTKEVDKQVIVKALRFCYGESISVGVKDGECCAMISVLKKLDIVCEESTSEDLITFARDESKKEMKTGVELLKYVQDYQECIDKRMGEKIASVVFTKKNVIEHFDTIVGECLMNLPSQYLDLVEYEEGHGEKSEFQVKLGYIREHEELGKEEKERIMKKCRWDDLKYQEMKDLKELDAVGAESLWEICEALFKHEEFEMEKHEKEMEQIESEKEKHRKQSLCLEFILKTEWLISQCFIIDTS